MDSSHLHRKERIVLTTIDVIDEFGIQCFYQGGGQEGKNFRGGHISPFFKKMICSMPL